LVEAASVDDQQLICVDSAMHGLAVTVLALDGVEQQHEIGRAEEAGPASILRC